MNIGFIGAGKAGTALGRYLVDHGVNVVGYVSRTESSAQRAANFTHTRSFSDRALIVASCDCLFITTTDGAIPSVWDALKREALQGSIDLSGMIVAHVSGCCSSALFSDAQALGAWACSVHPLLAFGDARTAYLQLSDAHFSLEGDARALEVMISLLEGLGNKTHVMDSRSKAVYHAAAVFASNFVLAPLDAAVSLLRGCGFSDDDAREALSVLIRANVDNFCSKGAVASLTGPIERGDATTVAAHLAALPPPEADLYRALAEALIGIARRKHPDRPEEEWRALDEALRPFGEDAPNPSTNNDDSARRPL